MKEDIKQAMNRYQSIINFMLQLRNGPVHDNFMSNAEDILDNGYDEDKAIKMSLNKNRHLIEEMFDEDDGEGDSDEDSDEEDDEEDDSGDEERAMNNYFIIIVYMYIVSFT